MPSFPFLPSVPATCRQLLLGTDPAQRRRAGAALGVLCVYLAFTALRTLDVGFGMVDALGARWLTLWELGGGLLFYALIRSGLNLRRARDRSLGTEQSVWAMLSICWAYAITGPSRGALIVIMVSTLSFSMFAMPPQRALALVLTGTSMLLSTMVWKACTSPDTHDPRVELMHFLCSVVVLAIAGKITVNIGRLRVHLQTQRSELAAALARIQLLATQDELTGLLNRRAALERLRSAAGEHGQPAPPLCVALIDLDRFKRINDGFGHAAGDLVLRHFAELARAGLRESDVLARWGGEEFLLVMPGADVAQGLQCLDRLRDRLRAHPVDAVAPGFVVCFSGGVSICTDADDLMPAIERADTAMYRAKQAGRDRTLAAAPAAPVGHGDTAAVAA